MRRSKTWRDLEARHPRDSKERAQVDGQFGLNLNVVFQHIGKAEVFSIALPTLRKALVVDMRSRNDDGPFVRVMPMARSASERLRSLKRLRPQLPRPQEILVIPWASFVNGLVASGIWSRLEERVAASGSDSALDSLDRALEELRSAESHELGLLLKGEQYETIWSRAR